MIKRSPNFKHRAAKEVRRQREEGIEPEFEHDWRYFSGTLYEMPIMPTTKDLVDKANLAIDFAQKTRKVHARKSKRGSAQRETDIKQALERLKKAMRPIRRELGRVPYEKHHDGADELREASEGMQRERRKLWKMAGPKNKGGRPKTKVEFPKYPKPEFNPEDWK